MQSLSDKKNELKEKRARSLMGKINILRSRDGSITPPIKSLKEADDFNLAALFGASMNENIDWTKPGIEGLIRIYYQITNLINGRLYNNIIKADQNVGTRSGLNAAVQLVGKGSGWLSGFFVGYGAGQDGHASDCPLDLQTQGNRGEFDKTSSSFTTNRDKINTSGSYQADDLNNSMLKFIDNAIEAIGIRSPLGQKVLERETITYQDLVSNGFIYETLLGKRYTDIIPYEFFEAHNTGGGGAGDGEPDVDPVFYPAKSVFGNGIFDTGDLIYTCNVNSTSLNGKYFIFNRRSDNAGFYVWFNQDSTGVDPKIINTTLQSRTGISIDYTAHDGFLDPADSTSDIATKLKNALKNYSMNISSSGSSFIFKSTVASINMMNTGFTYSVSQDSFPNYDIEPDYWDSTFISKLNVIIDRINYVIQFCNYAKVPDRTYFVSSNVIPGSSDNFATLNSWISRLNAFKSDINDFISYITPLIVSPNKTNSSFRADINTHLDNFKSTLTSRRADMVDLGNNSDSAAILGDPNNMLTLRGQRFLWVRAIIDTSEGSKSAVNGIQSGIDMMNKTIKKSEDELQMFGMSSDSWIPTPDIIGIEPNLSFNSTTFEMDTIGFIIAWIGQEHCTAYDIYKSINWDGTNGTWTKIVPSGNQYTVQSRDANNGKVLSSYTDNSINKGEEPYYKVKAYDINGGQGDYSRTNSQSDFSDPKSAKEFPTGGDTSPGTTSIANPKYPPVLLPEQPSSSAIPENALAWTTTHAGSDSLDIERKDFISDVPFDSQATNVLVFVDGKFKNQAMTGIVGDYGLKDERTIHFNDSVDADSEVNITVFIRKPWNIMKLSGSVAKFSDLPRVPADGEIYYVQSENKFYVYVAKTQEWKETTEILTDVNNLVKEPVGTKNDLPTIGNFPNDIRLVIDEDSLYRWNSLLTVPAWVQISGKSGSGYWKDPVMTKLGLPTDQYNQNGDVRLVITEERLYRWNSTLSSWNAIGASNNDLSWRTPVNTFDDLPVLNNVNGDVRLTLADGKIWRWDGSNSIWKGAKAEASVSHSELTDMPDAQGTNSDHDTRYHTKTEIDTVIDEIKKKLYDLTPLDADVLSGSFILSGTKFFSGYLSEGTSTRFDTLMPNQKFDHIIKDAYFNLANASSSQFKDGDSGILILKINDIEVDRISLKDNFVESERSSSQSYCPKNSNGGVITILSVEPYNNYPAFQRATYELNINSSILVRGENKIQLFHDVTQEFNEIRSTEPLIIFYDDFSGYKNFQQISVSITALNSNKYLSGVRHISIGDKLKLRFQPENTFRYTYMMPNQIKVDANDFGIAPFYINYQSDGVTTEVEPNVSTDFIYEKEMTVSVQNILSSSPEFNLTGMTPFGPSTVIKYNSSNMLINTATQMSTDLIEYFNDEIYRLDETQLYNSIPASIKNTWDSSSLISSGKLQVFNGKLIYPSMNFMSYLPQQTANYVGSSGTRYYVRAFKDVSPHNNGVFTIKKAKINDQNVSLFIKLPSCTGWLDLNKMYSEAQFTGADGDGCLIKQDNNDFYWTSEMFSSANSGGIILLKIGMKSNASQIEEVSLHF